MELPFKVMDADGHIAEDVSRIKEYMEPPYNDNLWVGVPDSQGRVGHATSLADTSFVDTTMGGSMGSVGPPGYPFPKDWLEALEWGGMDTTFLFPTNLLGYGNIFDPDYMLALTRAYNNYVSDEWLKTSPRLRAVSLVPLLDVGEGVKEMRRTITELGFSGVTVPAHGFGGLGDRRYDPFYEEAQSLGCLVAVHGNTPEYMRFNKFIQKHTASFPMSNMLQLVHMTYEGIFERFPNLRVGYLEGGCTWVPFFMNRMDEEWEKRGHLEAKSCKKEPSEYIKSDMVFFHAEPSEDLIPQVVELLGENSLFYASDWPHWDNEYPDNVAQFWNRDDLSYSAKKAILSDNTRRMYGMGPDD